MKSGSSVSRCRRISSKVPDNTEVTGLQKTWALRSATGLIDLRVDGRHGP